MGDELILSTNLFPVVGLGASAGGLAAFKRFIKAIPEKSGMAYVLVQHLDPDYESNLPEILQKVTVVPVLVITDDIKVAPDHIYIIPSNKMLIANDGVLQLSPRPGRGKGHINLPIDLFFTSLAEVHGTSAIGIVLSGKASDGTAGLRAIKAHGGITFAQEVNSADYTEMPHNAISAGVVDYILLPEEMPAKLSAVESRRKENEREPDLTQLDEKAFRQIHQLLTERKGADFSYYKQPTIRRRIARRMLVNNNDTPAEYFQLLHQSKDEQDALYNDLLIPVTTFFRDEKVFDALCKTVLPFLESIHAPGETLRIWVAACSTGQEAYSIAICIREYFNNADWKVQIFATDIGESAVAKARTGLYTKNEVTGLTQEHLTTFFLKTADGYLVKKEIRDMCVFAVHNFLTDPPFSRIDFISCRNVMIYLQPYLQKKGLAGFHYALNPKGYLLLGKSETAASTPELFAIADRTHKLFTRKDVTSKFIYAGKATANTNSTSINSSHNGKQMQTDFRKAADEMILSNYAPVGVVVNAQMDIVHFRGDTTIYLHQSDGPPTHNLMKLANSGLAFELRNAILKSKKTTETIVKEGIPIYADGREMTVTIKAVALPDIPEPYCLVLFQETTNNLPGPTDENIAERTTERSHQQNLLLQKELAQNREDMREVTEVQEAANEELQSANEELLSSSEEMQSLNEELETSKEELQSTNEELMVINQELLSLNEQVTTARTYAEAIVATIHQPLLVLDKDLRVKTANQAFYKTFHVGELETEHTLVYDLGNKQWNIPALRTLLEDILPEKKEFSGFEVTHTFTAIGQRIILLSGLEIMRDREEEKLILLAIEDITLRRTAEEELKISEAKFRKMADTMPQKVLTADANGIVNYFNQCWLDYTGRSFEQLSRDWTEVIHKDDMEETRRCWQHSVNTGDNYELEHRFLKSDGTYRWHLSRGLGQKDGTGAIRIWVSTSTEIQKQKEQRQELELAVAARTKELEDVAEVLLAKNEELQKMNKELEAFAYVSSHDLQEPLRKIETFSKMILAKELAVLSDSGKDYFRRIQGAAGRMRTLIEDLLSYSQTATSDRTFETINLGVIVSDVLRELKEPILESGAAVQVGKLCEVTVNASQFRQVLENLVGNALKFSRSGTPLQVRISSRIDNGKKFRSEDSQLSVDTLADKTMYCNVTIRDNGIGFEPQYNQTIFELFGRLHGKEEYPGTGIGLSIVKKIIEHHGGTITASGILNEGATFNLYIPTAAPQT